MKSRKTGFARGRRAPAGSYVGAKGLLQWVSKAHPKAYANLKRTQPDLIASTAQLSGLGDATSTVSDKVTQIANAVLPFLQLNAQRKLLNAQVSRAKAGLPPLDVSNMQLPASRVEFDAGNNISRFAKYGAIAGLGLLGLYIVYSGMRAQR